MAFVPQPEAVTATKSADNAGNNNGSTSTRYCETLVGPSARNSNSTGKLPAGGKRRFVSVLIVDVTPIKDLVTDWWPEDFRRLHSTRQSANGSCKVDTQSYLGCYHIDNDQRSFGPPSESIVHR